MAKVLTDAAVRKYRGGTQRREIRDGGARGLYLVVQPNGHKSWALRYRRPNGKATKLTLGPVDFSGKEPKDPKELALGTPLSLVAARAVAAEQHRQRAGGIDVAARHIAEKRRKSRAVEDAAVNTFAALARRFVDEHARPETRRWRDTARLLGLDYPNDKKNPSEIKGGLTQRWHDREVISITADDLYGVVDEARRIGIPGLARRRNGLSNTQGRAMGAALSKMFAWLVEHRRITTNPALGMYKPPAPDARDRVLSGIEIRWFWQACDELGEPFGALLKLLLLTGCRRDEVADMTHGELSDGGSVWTIPGQRTKNGRPHVAYLPPLAREIIAGLPKVEGRAGFLFTTIGTRPVSGWSKIKLRLDALMLKAAKQDGAGITPWRLHDLRRTAVTGMGELGIRPDVVELVVNHLSGHRGGIAGIYNRSELMPERRAALERWSQHVVGIVSGEPGNIVRLKGR